jgi:hypothetical protein
LVGFYRDGIGLPQIGEFRDHEGYDGVFLALPGTGAHLELTAGGEHAGPRSHPESLLVLYLGDRDAVASVVARLISIVLEVAATLLLGAFLAGLLRGGRERRRAAAILTTAAPVVHRDVN